MGKKKANNDLVITPIKDTGETESKYDKEIREMIHENLLVPPFLLLIIAPVKSGKSVLITNLITKMYKNVFDQVILISPTCKFDKSLRPIYDDLENVIIDDMENLDDKVKVIIDEQKNISDDDKRHICIILDDCLGFFYRNSYIDFLCTRFRHYKASLIITTQNFRSLSNKIRNNATSSIIFKTNNDLEYKKIKEEYSGQFLDFDKLYKKATSEKYNFLYLDFQNVRAFKNFTDLLYEKK